MTVGDTAAEMFYRRLFELDPDLQPLFGSTDMTAQRKKLIQSLSLTSTPRLTIVLAMRADEVEEDHPFARLLA